MNRSPLLPAPRTRSMFEYNRAPRTTAGKSMNLTEHNAEGLKRISSDRFPITRIIDQRFSHSALGKVPKWLLAIGLVIGAVITYGLIIPLYLFAAIFYLGLRGALSMIPEFADRVEDGGDHLIVSQKGASRRIGIAQIEGVEYRGYNNPPRIRIRLRPGTLGPPHNRSPEANIVTFFPDLSRGRDAARLIADDLNRRAEST